VRPVSGAATSATAGAAAGHQTELSHLLRSLQISRAVVKLWVL
jgi:hypothetical protein